MYTCKECNSSDCFKPRDNLIGSWMCLVLGTVMFVLLFFVSANIIGIEIGPFVETLKDLSAHEGNPGFIVCIAVMMLVAYGIIYAGVKKYQKNIIWRRWASQPAEDRR